MTRIELSFALRKALCVQLGEPAGQELAAVLQKVVSELQQLDRKKVDVTPIVPSANRLERQDVYEG